MVVLVPETESNENGTIEKHVESSESTEATSKEVEDYETTSEGEDDENGEEKPAPSKDDLYEDAMTDEQLKQRSLDHASDAKAEGNELFKSGQYEDALLKYEYALYLVSEISSSEEIRSICHANRAICYTKLGKYEDTIKECAKALELNPTYLKALIRRAEAHEKLEHFEEAIADFKKILELDPSNDQAHKSIRRLEPLAAEKREKMKEEMIGKLKEMGNSLLGRFGMSVDNFKAVKDPNTGSYSVSFQR
ncbi:hypothetical protein AQUCO_04000088v1 [Aquilegia coerulea]|uniref:Uncharacterized protein n=1 Tax=Aquilegia coerulea TaxID=218851 RepID=A0A2G5CSI2_AQUCA|nr:hypothetical protein AQUCO_04000088v1 [Aquilegia coerulea]